MTSKEQFAPLLASKLIANMSELDRKATSVYGIAGLDLMEKAGAAVARQVLGWVNHSSEPEKTDILILCGPGNNGGDGFVCARHLLEAGLSSITVWYVENKGKTYSSEAFANFQKLQALAGKQSKIKLKAWPPEESDSDLQWKETAQEHPTPDIVVDSLFGSGLNKPVTGIYARWIDWLNVFRSSERHHQPYHMRVLSVDLPSGLDSQTGEILGTAVKADMTLTLAAGKPGLYLKYGRLCAGHIHVVDIGFPQHLIDEDESAAFLISQTFAGQGLPTRSEIAHKYQMGHVLVIAGSGNMPGAAKLCAEAALSAGVGVVTLAAPKSVFQNINISPEIIRLPLSENADGFLSGDIMGKISPILEKVSSVTLGPGMGHNKETAETIESLINSLANNFPGYVVIDADALNILAQRQSQQPLSQRFVLTPHIGEAKRLAKGVGIPCEDSDIRDACSFANSLSRAYQALLVLKSASTIVSDGTWSAINPTGNNGMATAGSGDVLSGIMGSLLAQYHANRINPDMNCGLQSLSSQQSDKEPATHIVFSKPNPVLSAVYLHGLSGDCAAKVLGPRCLRASHLIEYLPEAFFNLKTVLRPEHKPNYKTGRVEALASNS